MIEYTITDLGAIGGLSSEASDVNNSGIVVGTYKPDNSTGRTFRYINGNMDDLGNLPHLPENMNSSGHAVNWAGQVVGMNAGTQSAYIWDNSATTDLDVPTSYDPSLPNDINDSG